MSGFVRTTALRTHADELGAVAEQVGSAARSGAGTELGPLTYGLVGAFVVTGVQDAVAEACAAITGTAAGLERVADALRVAADVHDRTEAATTDALTRAGR